MSGAKVNAWLWDPPARPVSFGCSAETKFQTSLVFYQSTLSAEIPKNLPMFLSLEENVQKTDFEKI